MVGGYYPPAQGCDEVMNAYCASSCNKPYMTLARYGGPISIWRCMPLSVLSEDTITVVGSGGWCNRNRDNELPGVLASCLESREA